MNLTVNGEATRAPDAQSVRDLMVRMGLGEKPVAVEVNRQVVPRRQHSQTTLREGDVVEIVTLVGGG